MFFFPFHFYSPFDVLCSPPSFLLINLHSIHFFVLICPFIFIISFLLSPFLICALLFTIFSFFLYLSFISTLHLFFLSLLSGVSYFRPRYREYSLCSVDRFTRLFCHVFIPYFSRVPVYITCFLDIFSDLSRFGVSFGIASSSCLV